MRFLGLLALSLLATSPITFAQDKPEPAVKKMATPPPRPDPAPAPAPDLGQLQAAERQLQQAQQAMRDAQLGVDAARRVQGQALNDLHRSNPSTRRYTVVRQFDGGRPAQNQFVTTYGLNLAEIDPVLHAQLSLPEGEGLVVLSVTKGGQADQTGIKEKDVITKVNLQPVNKVKAARDAITNSDKKLVYFDLVRAGQPVHLNMAKPDDSTTQPMTYWIGIPVAPVDATLRSHLPELAAGTGLIATDVVADSPAARSGVQKYDILVRVGGQKVTSNEDLIKQVQQSDGKAIAVEVLRGGKLVTLSVFPEKRPMSPLNALTETLNGELSKAKVDGFSTIYEPFYSKPADNSVSIENAITEINRGALSIAKFRHPQPTEAETNTKMEKELKDMAAQLETLRKMIEALGKTPAAGSQPKAND